MTWMSNYVPFKTMNVIIFLFPTLSWSLILNGLRVKLCRLWFLVAVMGQVINYLHGQDRLLQDTIHYDDVIMGTIASQITSLTSVYSTVYSAQIKVNIKAPRQWPLCGEFTGDRWIPRTNGQLRGKCFHLMTSSCSNGAIFNSLASVWFGSKSKSMVFKLIRHNSS